MRMILLTITALIAATAVAEAQTTIYWKRDHIYAGPGGGEIAIVTPAPSDSTAPGAPTSLGTTSITATSVALSWTGSSDSGGSGLAGYKIYRQKGSGASLPVGTVNSSTTAFTDQPLEPSTAYTYKVVAFDNAQNHSGASNTVSPTTSSSSGDTTAPSAPTNLRGRPTGRQTTYKVKLDWNAATDAGGTGISGYKVYRNGTLISGSSPITALYYEDSTNSANTAFAYNVKAVDGAGNLSADSNTATVTTLRYLIGSWDFNTSGNCGTSWYQWCQNTLRWVDPGDGCYWWASALYCFWNDVVYITESTYRMAVSVLNTSSEFSTGIFIWSDNGRYRLRIGSTTMALEYWPDDDPANAVVVTSASKSAGGGSLVIEATSSTRNIKVYWNNSLKFNYTETNTSRPNTGNSGISSLATGYESIFNPMFDDIVVERLP